MNFFLKKRIYKGRFPHNPIIDTWNGKSRGKDMSLVRLSLSRLCSELLGYVREGRQTGNQFDPLCTLALLAFWCHYF